MKSAPRIKQQAKPKIQRRRNLKAAAAVEIAPDGWERFTGAVKKIAPPKLPKSKSSKSL